MSRTGGGTSRSDWRRKLLAVAVASCFSGTAAANPTGPTVVHGQAGIAVQGNTLTVTNTPGTVIHWQGFSIAGNEITRFIQQSQTSSVLNRVVGLNPSAILGSLQSNGRVFLVNPNGITIGAGAQIDVAGFLASTLNLSDTDFLAGRMRFTDGAGAGSVINHGNITTPGGGMVYLVGRDVQNSGIIRSPQGDILLAAGNRIELVDAQMPEVRVEVTAPDNQSVNLGQLIAEGGSIGMYGALLRHSGVASANAAVMGENGRIVFRAARDVTLEAGSQVTANGPLGGSVTIQAETGSALLSGTVTATGDSGTGGTVRVLGERVGLFDGAAVNVSGSSGGGTALIGGDFQGGNAAVQNASRTFFGAGAAIAADAVENGNGGKVILWSDDLTRAFGSVSARGGAQSGNGGFVEISGKQGLAYAGAVNTLAPFGKAGMLLLDPADLDIVATGNLDVSGASPFAPLGGDGAISTLGWDTITGVGGLGGGNVIITTVGTPATGSETGRIRIQAAGTYASANSLTINAAGAIEVNAPVTNSGAGALSLDAQGGALNVAHALTTTGGAINLTGSGGISLGADLTSGGGNIAFNGVLALTAANPLLSAGGGNISFSSTVDGGTNSLTTNNTGTLSFGGAIGNVANLTIQGGPSGIVFPQTTLTGNLDVTSAGNVTQSGALTVTGTSGITVTTGDLGLAGFDNSFGGAVTATASGGVSLRSNATALMLGDISAGGTGLGLYLNGNVSQSGGTAITSSGPALIEVNAAGLNVLLDGTTNNFGGNAVTFATAGAGSYNYLSLRDTNAGASLGGLPANIGGNLALHFDNAGISMGAVTVGGNLNLVAGNGIQQTGVFSVTGTSNLNSGTGSVALAGFDNSFGGAVTATAAGTGSVALRNDNTPLLLGNVSTGAAGLGLYLNGNVSQSGGSTISSGGAVLVEVNAASSNVILGNAGNNFGGNTTTLTTLGAGTLNNLSVRDANAGASITGLPANIGGNLTLHFDNTGMILAGVTVGGNLQAIAGGAISVTGAVSSVGTAALQSTSGNIGLGGNFGSTGAAVTLTSAGNITQTGGMVSGSSVTLDSATGVGGGTGARVATATNSLAARSTTSGGVFVSEADGLALAILSGVANGAAGGGAYDLTAGGTITVSTAVNGAGSGSTVLTTTAGGNMVLGADVGNSSAATTLTSAGNITQTSGLVTGTDVILDSATGVGGGTGSRVAADAVNLAARSTTSGGVFVSENNAVMLTTLSGVANTAAGGGAYDLTAAGALTVSAAINGGGTGGSNLTTTAGGNMALGASVGNAAAATTLTSDGNITQTAGSVTGIGVLLDAANAIGTGGARIGTAAGTLAARTGGSATGGIFITETDSAGIGTVGSVSGVSAGNGGAADVRTTVGDLTIAANVSATGSGNVTLIAGGGGGNDLIAGAGRVSTGSGLVTLQGDAVGTTVAPILTGIGSGTLSATSSAGNIAVSNNTTGGLNISQLTALTTGGGTQTISIVQTVGNLTVDSSLNVGGDTLVLGATAGDILGAPATTLTAASLTLDAGGLIGGVDAVNTGSSGALTLNSGGTAAAGNITVIEANALPTSRISLGGAGAGGGRSVKLTSVTGPVTIDGAIGNAADHLELVATAGNIAGGAGTVTATNLVLNAAAGIGAGTAVNTNTSGNLSLTTAGNGAAGDIALLEGNALNTTRIATLATGGTGTQSVNLMAPSITLGSAIGNAADNLTLIAASGAIIGGSGIVTANDLRLDAHNGIGSSGTPVQINTAGNFAARLTNASATGDIIVEEVAAGAGLSVGTANGLSGVVTTNNRNITLSAESGNIVLNQQINSVSGQVSLTTTGSGNVSVAAGISSGLVGITSAGTIIDSAQIGGSTLTTSSVGGTILDFGHAVSGFNASNVTGGNIQLVNTAPTLTVTGISQNGGGNVIVNNTGVLTIGGAINNAGSGGAINLTGSTGINLNQNLTATDGAITLNNGTTLGASVQIAAGTGSVTLTGAVGIGSHNLTVSSSGITALNGGITGSTGNIDIAAATRTDVDGAIALSGAGTVQLDRAVVSGVNVSSTGGGITFDGAASTDTGPVQVASGGGNVLFNDTLTLGSGAGLTVLSGAGTTTFGGAVNGPTALAVTASGNTIFSGTVGAGTALASLSTDGGGVTRLNGASVATSGAQGYSDAVTLGADTTLAANSITFGSTLNSAGAARTLQINDSGTTTFGGAVGNSLALASLTTNAGGSTAINGGSVVTSGTQNYGDAVTLGANTTLSANSITFGNTLNSVGVARTLQINDSGTTTFGGTIGNTLALASLTTNAGGSTAINTTTVNTTGTQTYNDAVTLGADAVLASSGSGDIRFLSALDGASGLTVNTTGATVFSSAVGSTTPLAFLTTNSGGTTQVNGGTLVTSGTQTYNDAVSIGGATTFNATASSAALAFNSTLAAAAHALTLSADEINLSGGAGSVTGTGTVTLQPHSIAAAVNVGSVAGATVGVLDLAAADIAALADGLAAIQIGRADGAHAIGVGNASFQDPLLLRAPAAGSIGINGALSGTQQVTLEAGAAVQGSGSVTAPLVKVVAGGIGSFATPLQIDAPQIDILNVAGNAVIRTPGPVTPVNNFRNNAAGGELRLITQNGAIDTGAVAVQSAGGRIALIASDTAGGATGGITVGVGGISSGGGDIVLHAADNIVIGGTVTAGAGNVRMIAGTGPGINAGHATFSGSNPAAATELVQDEFGMIVFNAPVSAGSMTLVSSTTATPTITPVITQGATGSLSTTGALTAVSLRGGGAPGNGGGTIDLNDAAGNNSTGLINLFACSFDGCPVALPIAPFLNQGVPVPPFTTALYSDGQLFYSDVGGTNVTGIGTSGDFTLYTPGSVTITGPSLSAKNLTIEALVDINVDLLAPFTNSDINGGQPGGSLNFIAGQNLNYTSTAAGATIGTAAVPFNHNLLFQAAGSVTIANGIYVGNGNLVVSANAPANLNNNTVNIPASGTGSVLMQGNHVVSSQAGLAVSGVNLTVQGGDAGSLNQAAAGQQLLSAGTIHLNLLGDVTVSGGAATAGSDGAAIIRGGVVNIGSAATPVANLAMTGGSSMVTGTANHVADAQVEGTGSLNVHVAGDVTLAGGTAEIAATAGSSQKAGASAILKGNNFVFNVAGNVSLTGGTANSATGGNTATANAQVIAGSAFNPLIQGDLSLEGGNATAQPIPGELANAVASARFESAGDLLLKVSGDIVLQGGQAVAANTAGGLFAEADAGASVRSSARIGIEAGQDFDITGGQASVSGTSIRAIASAGVLTGNVASGQTMLVNTAGNMSMTGGFSNGAAGDAAALVYSSGEAKLNIGGSSGLRLEGGSGPFFPPFDAGVFTPNSDLFHMIGNDSLVRIAGSAYPVTVTGLISVVPNPARGAAFLVSEAPPLSLDSLLAAFIRTTDCVSFSGGACTLSEAAASSTRRGMKDPAGGVCK